jgi:hypothetical protein
MHSIRHHPASVGTQIRQFGRGATGHRSEQDAARSGGSARGYHQLFTWLAVRKSQIPPRRTVGQAVCLCIAALWVNFLICRVEVRRITVRLTADAATKT